MQPVSKCVRARPVCQGLCHRVLRPWLARMNKPQHQECNIVVWNLAEEEYTSRHLFCHRVSSLLIIQVFITEFAISPHQRDSK